jgi:hypothetical protein
MHWRKSEANVDVVQKSLPVAQLGTILFSVHFGRKLTNSDNCKAPENLTGCGHERPEGLFECTFGLIVEVRPAIVHWLHMEIIL